MTRGPMLTEIRYETLTKRRISLETCKLWGYGKAELSGETVQVAQYKNADGTVVAQKIRTPDKRFSWKGAPKQAGLYGQWLWGKAKIVTVVEGEIDALSVSEVQNNKWPVVSVPNGAPAAAKAIGAAVEWLETFEKVVFLFDQDAEGSKAAIECAGLLSPGKAFIGRLPLKDASEMLQAGRGGEIVGAIFGAVPYRPDGVVCGSEVWDKVIADDSALSIPYPWECFNRKLRGCRPGELVLITAGTGVGKSEVTRQIAECFHDRHSETIGYIALEENTRRTALGFMGLKLGRLIHVDKPDMPEAELKKLFDETIGSGRYYIYSHFGSLDADELIKKIRYMVRGCGCGTIVLDHVSIVVSGSDLADERKALDILMTNLASLVQELNVRMIVICHLRRVEGVCHEEGDPISLSHLRGTGAIAQLSHIVVALERNQQSEKRSQFTRVRILKNRPIGLLGVSGWLEYNQETGRLADAEPPKEDEHEENPDL